MTLYEQEILIATDREKPTHGYDVGKFLFDSFDQSMYQLVSKNPHIWRQTGYKSPLSQKYGRYEANGMTVFGEGLMRDMVGIGASFTPNGIDGTGSNQSFGTGSVIQNAGIGILRPISGFSGLTRTNHLPYYIVKEVLTTKTGGDYRHYSGWIRNTTGPAVGETPILNTEGGIVVGFNAADTTWQVWHSNGDGSTAVSKVSLNNNLVTPASAAQYRVEMIYTSLTNVIVNILNASAVVVDTKTITSNLPPTGLSLNWVNVVQNPTAVNRTCTLYSAFMTSNL